MTDGEREHLAYRGGNRRQSDIVMHLAKRFVDKFYGENAAMDRVLLFGQVRALFTEWINSGYLKCQGGATADIVVEFPNYTDEACNRVNDAIVRRATEEETASVSVLQDDFLPTGSTSSVNFRISTARDGAGQIACQLRRLRFGVGGNPLPRRRGAPADARLREEQRTWL